MGLGCDEARVVPPVALHPQCNTAQQAATTHTCNHGPRLDTSFYQLVDQRGMAFPKQRVLIPAQSAARICGGGEARGLGGRQARRVHSRRDVLGTLVLCHQRAGELVCLVPVGAVHGDVRSVRAYLVEHDRLGRLWHDHMGRHL